MQMTSFLKMEHKKIKAMLQIISRICLQIETGKKVVPEHLEIAVEWISGFADKRHHAKEEKLLFPALEIAGIPVKHGPVGCMLEEHEISRGYVRKMRRAVEDLRHGMADAKSAFLEAARAYTGLLEQHIDKEDNILYQMANSFLSPEQQRQLELSCGDVEAERGRDELNRFDADLRLLSECYGLAPA